jgi:hypothetical protein
VFVSTVPAGHDRCLPVSMVSGHDRCLSVSTVSGRDGCFFVSTVSGHDRCCEVHTERTNIVCGQDAVPWQVVYVVTIGL